MAQCYARTAPLLGLACTSSTLDWQATAEAIDALTHQFQFVLDVAEEPAVLGHLSGEIFVLDAGHIKHVAGLDSPFTSPPIGVPAFYAHTAQRAHDARTRIG